LIALSIDLLFRWHRNLSIFIVLMSVQKTITQVYKAHEDAFNKSLVTAKNLKEKQVHKLRVEIKNLRILFDLLKTVSQGKLHVKPALKLLTPVFKKAGEMRTSHLNIDLTKTFRSPVISRFREHLKEKEKQAGKKLVKKIKDFKIEKLDHLHKDHLKAFQKVGNDTIESSSKTFMKEEFAKVKTEMGDIHNDEVLHDIRKRLKTVKNLGKLLDEMHPDKELQKELKKINHTYERIGEWHDAIILVEELEKYVEKHETSIDRKKATPIIRRLKQSNEKRKKVIAGALKKELS
jgi:CHAD domain-containing protein